MSIPPREIWERLTPGLQEVITDELQNSDLRGKGGCWCIVTVVHNYSCTVKIWNGELTVGLKHLKSYDYLPADCEQMQILCDRISRVFSSGLEESVQRFLEEPIPLIPEI